MADLTPHKPTPGIAVAMSGGVDSSVTAALLKQQGWQVHGVFMAIGQPDLDRQIERVARLARTLEVELTIFDLQTAFEREVIDYFCRGYNAGQTPNPCVVCNRRIKAGLLLERVRAELGVAVLATGHYARIRREADGLFHLRQGRDERKDQSYFLSRLQQSQLASLLFPLGEYTKVEVRRLAARFGLASLHSPESQDICFLKNQKVGEFLAARLQPAPGLIVDLEGRPLGKHAGIHHYTVGQRRGLGLPAAAPYYVLRLEAAAGRVVVGRKEDLHCSTLLIRDLHWLGEPPPLPCEVEVRIRYRHQPAAACLSGAGRVRFREPQRAVTPGQFAVFYRGDEVLGAGEIGDLEPPEEHGAPAETKRA